MICRNCGKEIQEGSKFCTFCGYKFEEDQVAQPNIQNVKLIFTRKSKIVGMAMSMNISIDKNKVAVLKNGQTQEIEVSLGQHEIIIDTGVDFTKEVIDCTSEYSKIYFDIVMKFGLVTGKPSIEAIRKEK